MKFDAHTWRDLYWLTLYFLGWLSYFAYVVIGVGVSVGLGGFAYGYTGSRFLGGAFAAWGLVQTLLGLGYIRFYWNHILLKEKE